MAIRKEVPYNDNNLAIGYYRFSSSGQDTSIEQQREAAHKYAEAHGLIIIKEYDDPAISGTSADRPKFRQMLAEVKELRPGALILWKTDRLSRNSYDVAIAKRIIRDAGCKIHYIAEKTPDGSPEDELMEHFLESMADYYSKQLSVNVRRGMRYNYERGLYVGVALLGYTTEGEGRHNKRYIIDKRTAPIVRRIFNEYANGKSMQRIAEQLNSEGWRTARGGKFTANGIRKTLKNESYIGVYRFGGQVIEDGMPVIIDKTLFDRVQKRLLRNKKFGMQNARGLDENEKPRFWLTGKLYCGECGNSMSGSSGTSKSGKKHFYYTCIDQHKGKRGNGCKKSPVRKEFIEEFVCHHLSEYLKDSENLTSLAVDIAEYYKREYDDHGYLDGLEAELKETENALKNVIKAVMNGAYGKMINNQLSELEERKKGLIDAIDAEKAKQGIMKDETSIKKYFERFKNADMHDPQMRDMVLEYFVDKIYLYDDRLIVTGKWQDSFEEIGYLFLDDIVHKKDDRTRSVRLSRHLGH